MIHVGIVTHVQSPDLFLIYSDIAVNISPLITNTHQIDNQVAESDHMSPKPTTPPQFDRIANLRSVEAFNYLVL